MQSNNYKHGIGFNNAKYNYMNRTTFVKSSAIYRHVPSCSYCCKEGHLKFACPYRRKDSYIIKNTFSFEIREHVRQIWVPKRKRQPNMVHPEYAPKFETWSAK